MLQEQSQPSQRLKQESQFNEQHDKPQDQANLHHNDLTLIQLDDHINSLIILLLLQQRTQQDEAKIDEMINLIDKFNDNSIQMVNEVSSNTISKLAFISILIMKLNKNMMIQIQKINYMKSRLMIRQTDLLRDPLRGYQYYLGRNMKLGVRIEELMAQPKVEIKNQDNTILQSRMQAIGNNCEERPKKQSQNDKEYQQKEEEQQQKEEEVVRDCQ